MIDHPDSPAAGAAPFNAEVAGDAFRQPNADAMPSPVASAPPSRHEDPAEPAPLPRAPYQVRVVAEKAELDDRTQKLGEFLSSPAIGAVSKYEVSLMRRQFVLMHALSIVLGERIDAFNA